MNPCREWLNSTGKLVHSRQFTVNRKNESNVIKNRKQSACTNDVSRVEYSIEDFVIGIFGVFLVTSRLYKKQVQRIYRNEQTHHTLHFAERRRFQNF